MSVLDFDEVGSWDESLSAALAIVVPPEVTAAIRAAQPQFIEDSLKLLFDLADRSAVIDATLEWISRHQLAAYHGTRLTPEEVESVRATGLRPLKAEDRLPRLGRALARHPEWGRLRDQLDQAVRACGTERKWGNRENQVHLTVSKAGLCSSFDHYLRYGSEFDQRVLQEMLGEEGLRWLEADGDCYLVRVAVPGADAINAAHWSWSLELMRQTGDTPNLVDDFLKAWSFRRARPRYQPRSQMLDSGLIFSDVVPASWIVEVVPFQIAESSQA